MEKRGYIDSDWTPPAGSAVTANRGQFYVNRKVASKVGVEELDNDATRRLADYLQHLVMKR